MKTITWFSVMFSLTLGLLLGLIVFAYHKGFEAGVREKVSIITQRYIIKEREARK